MYFYAETSEPLTPHTGNNWMLLLIDADQNPDTGWYGYDYLINKRVVDDKHDDADALRSEVSGPAVGRAGAASELPLRGQGAGAGRAAQLLGLQGRRIQL